MIRERVKYLRIRRGSPFFVIADLGLGDHFFDQESGELQWREFRPSAQERAFAYELRDQGGGTVWPNFGTTFQALARRSAMDSSEHYLGGVIDFRTLAR
ncbi:MAG: hypothetical protein C5B51_13680 [Terriglobia bacterium]|nr:MAG: hypothetical protein C5B51_13680 [Terriglobia bacterium]